MVARRPVDRVPQPPARRIRPDRQLGRLRRGRRRRAPSRASSRPSTGPTWIPSWGNRAPSWSPDGKLIAYVQGGKPELLYYGGQKVAVVPAAGGPARVLTAALDRNVLSPTFSSDGSIGPVPAGGRPGLSPGAGARGRGRGRAAGRGQAGDRGSLGREGRADRAHLEHHGRSHRGLRGRGDELRKVSRSERCVAGAGAAGAGRGDLLQEPGWHRRSTGSWSSRPTTGRDAAIPPSCASTADRCGSTTTTSPTSTGRSWPPQGTWCSG